MLTLDGYYIQKNGLAMGSPLSPLLANAWLTKFDKRFEAMNTKFFFRYVYDICMTLDTDIIPQVLETINCWQKCLEFTCETEDCSGGISFLDMKICHKYIILETTWFSKPTSNGLPLNFHALSPIQYKNQWFVASPIRYTILVAIGKFSSISR